MGGYAYDLIVFPFAASAIFDAPNNDVVFFPGYAPPPVYPPEGSLGFIQHTIGNSRFLQLSLHLRF